MIRELLTAPDLLAERVLTALCASSEDFRTALAEAHRDALTYDNYLAHLRECSRGAGCEGCIPVELPQFRSFSVLDAGVRYAGPEIRGALGQWRDQVESVASAAVRLTMLRSRLRSVVELFHRSAAELQDMRMLMPMMGEPEQDVRESYETIERFLREVDSTMTRFARRAEHHCGGAHRAAYTLAEKAAPAGRQLEVAQMRLLTDTIIAERTLRAQEELRMMARETRDAGIARRAVLLDRLLQTVSL